MGTLFLVCDLHEVRGSPADPRVRYRIRSCEICGGQSGTVIGVSPVLRFSPVTTIPPMPHTHLRVHGCSHQQDKQVEPDDLPKKPCFFGNRGALCKKYFRFFMARVGGRHSSVGIATRYGLENPEIESR